MAEEHGIPMDEHHQGIYFDGLALRKKALQLLKDARAFKVRFWRRHKDEVDFLANRYDTLYGEYVNYDAQVSSYTRMCSDPWYRDEHTNEMRSKDIEHLTKLNISSEGLLSQRESVRLVLTDISSQVNNLYSDINNFLVNWLTVVSLVVALASLIIAVVALKR